MMVRKLRSVLWMLLIFAGSNLYGQVSLLTRAQGTLTVCGNSELFTVELNNTTASVISSVTLLPRLQTGVEYIAGSAAVVSGSGVTVSETNISNLTDPHLLINSLPVGTTVISYRARANCAVINLLVNGKTNNSTHIDYGSTHFDEPNGSESYNVIFPELEPFVTLNEITTDVNIQGQRTLTVRNSGPGAASHLRLQIQYDNGLSPVSLAIGTVLLTPTSISGTTREYLLDINNPAFASLIGDGDGLLEQNESIVFTEKIIGLQCGRLGTQYKSLWGCAKLQTPSSEDICNVSEQVAVTNAYLNITDGEPATSITRNIVQKTDLCSSSKARFEYVFTNTGSGNSPASVDGARSLVLNMSLPLAFTAFNFQIKNSSGTFIPITGAPSSSGSNFTLTLGNTSGTPLIDIDNDGQADDLPVGATIVVSMDMAVSCPTEFGTFSSSFNKFLFATFNYNDNCGAGKSNFNLFTYANTFNNARIEGPPDLSDAQNEHYIFTSNWTTQGIAELLDCSQGNFYSKILVPLGYKAVSATWNGSAISFSQASAGAEVTLNGGGYAGSYDVEFMLDCQGVSSTDPYSTFFWQMYQRCNSSCNCEQQLVLQNYDVFNHCPECTGFHAKSFNLERTTFGQVMPASGQYTYADMVAAAKVDRNTPGVRLDRVYELDEFSAKATGLLDVGATASYANNKVHYEIRYTSPISNNILEVLGATFTVDNGSIQTYTVGPVTAVSGGGRVYVYDFTLPGTGTINPGDKVNIDVQFRVKKDATLPAGEFLLQQFRADLYGIKPDDTRQRCEDFGDALTVLKGRIDNYSYYSLWGCGGILDPSSLRFFSGTQEEDFPNEFRPLAYFETVTIKLPPGYRYKTNSAYIVNRAYSIIAAEDATHQGVVTPDPTGDVVTFTRAPFWVITETAFGTDAQNWATLFRIDMEPKCATGPVCSPTPNYGAPFQQSPLFTFTYSTTSTYKTYAYAIGQEVNVTNSQTSFGENDRRSELNLIANGIKDGYQKSVTWPVQICNNVAGNVSSASNTWVTFEPEHPNTQPFTIKNTDNGTFYGGTDVVRYGPSGQEYMMVNIGNIPLNQCRNLEFSVKYTNCVQDVIDNINVTSGWSCQLDRIPVVTGHTGKICSKITDCEHGIKTDVLQLRYKNADYQWTVQHIGAAKVNLCEDIPFEIKLTSALTADMTDIYFAMDLPPGITYVPGSGTYTYPLTGTPQPIPQEPYSLSSIWTAAPNNIGWEVVLDFGTTPVIGNSTGVPILTLISNSLPGTRLSGGQNEVLLKFNLKASCTADLDAGNPVNFFTKGTTNCQKDITLQQQRKIQLLDDPDSMVVSITSTAFTGCQGNNTLTVSLRNGLTRVTQAEAFTIELPADVSYVAPSTFTGVLAGLSLGEPTIIGNKLQWTLPSGLAVGSLGSVSFQTQLINNTPAGGKLIFVANTKMNGTATCVTDLSSCPLVMTTGQDRDTMLVSFPKPVAKITSSPASDSICSGKQIDLVASLTYPVGVTPSAYTCNWTSGNVNAATNCTVTISPNATSTYTVIVEDVNHCKDTASKTITVLPLPSITQIDVKGTTCKDKKNGKITVEASASSASAAVALTLKLNNTVVATAVILTGSQYTFTGLDQGDYTVEVRDTSTGCVKSIPINVPYNGPRIDALCSTSIPCNSTSSRVTFRITAVRPYTNNHGDYTFRVLMNGTTPVPIDLDASDLPTVYTQYNSFDANSKDIVIAALQMPGTYILELTDDSGCVITQPFVIKHLKFTASVNKNSTEFCYATEKRDVPVAVLNNEDCIPPTNVAYTFQLFKLKKPQLVYLPLSGAAASSQPFYNFASLDTGSYKVIISATITGQQPCKDSLFFDMTYKSTFYIDTVTTHPPLCHNTATGTACAVVKGGSGAITYQWVDPSTNKVVSTDACATGLEGGKTYTLLVTDENGCADPLSHPVTIPAGPPALGPPIVNSVDTACSATAQPFNVNNGTPPFRFDWHKIDTIKTSAGADSIRNRSVFYDAPIGPDYVSTRKPIKKGYYRIYIIDANGCRDSVDHYFGRPRVAMQYQICMNWTTYSGEGPKKPPVPTDAEPAFPTPVVDMITFNEKVQECVDRQVNLAKAQYVQLCQTGKALDDQLNISYNSKYEHITLYYYDRGGRLVKTVPPAGVALVNPPNNTATPAHTLVTTYEYNSLSLVTSQNTPDGGKIDFIYNDKGQLRYSQNARQVLDNTFSYTNFNTLGRIEEVGQDKLTGSLIALDPLASQLSATSNENTQTVYTQPASGISYNGKPQRFLRNRVSYIYILNQNGDREYTYYSYDPHGNVEWLIQEIQGFSRTSVAYEYDLISNKVLQVKFNEGRKDQFFQRYSYDASDRIIQAETSHDEIAWDKDASYQYYLHGPLQRIGLGEDRVQGIDYAYMVQGWLKGINSPDLKTTEDLGGDGINPTSGFPQDQFGMSLGYFNGDYTAANSFGSSTYTMPGIKNLYNGNISNWSDKIGYASSGQYSNTLTGNRYTYDKLNRIRKSEFGAYNSGWSMQGNTGEYYTSYTYDPNGNLQSLRRNAYGSNNAMDSLTYNYVSGTNKLDHVDEQISGAQNGQMQDITDQDFGNYGYDAIGNLVKDTSEHIHIKWNIYGKVTEVIPDKMSANQKPHLKFSYDAAGNRIKKQINRQPYFTITNSFKDSLVDPATFEITYYSRDASGTVMGIYERHHTPVSGKPGYYNAIYLLKELPIYGINRLGEIQLNDTIAVKMFKKEDFDKVNFLQDGLERITTLHNPIVAGYNEAFFKNSTDSASIYEASVYTYPVPGALSVSKVDFLGSTGNNLAVGEDSAGAKTLEFYAVTANWYWGRKSTNLVYDKTNRLMKGIDTNAVDTKAKSIVVKQPGTNKNYFLFTRDTLGILNYHKVEMSKIGYGTASAPSGEITSHTALSGSGYGRHMAVVEDYINNYALVYVTTHDTSTHQTTLLQLQIDDQGGIAQTPLYTYSSFDKYGEGEIQISPDGASLAIYNHKKAYGFFNHRNIELITLKLDASYKPLDQAVPKVYAYAYGNYPKGSVELSTTGEHLYFEQVSLVNFINGTGNKATYRQSLKTITIDTLAEGTIPAGDLRRSESNYLYSFYNKQMEQDAWKDTLSFSTTPITTTYTTKLKGYLAYQPHKVLLKENHEQVVYREVGDKLYELNDHLGNVRVVITDRKQPIVQAGLIVGLSADVSAYNNFYAFGMLQSGRNYNSSDYRYGFNGKEKDDEIKGGGNSYDFGTRIYDPRLGRFLSIDPMGKEFPWMTPYCYAGNNPIRLIDVEGAGPDDPIRLIFHGGANESSANQSFLNAATNKAKQYTDYTPQVINVNKASTIISTINSQKANSIQSVDIMSHGGTNALYLVEPGILFPTNNSLYKNSAIKDDWNFASSDAGIVNDIDFSKFTNNAKIEFHGCMTCGGASTDHIVSEFSKKLYAAGKLNAVVIGHGTSANPNINGGGEKPEEESYEHGLRIVYHNGERLFSTTMNGRITGDIINKYLTKKAEQGDNYNGANETYTEPEPKPVQPKKK